VTYFTQIGFLFLESKFYYFVVYWSAHRMSLVPHRRGKDASLLCTPCVPNTLVLVLKIWHGPQRQKPPKARCISKRKMVEGQQKIYNPVRARQEISLPWTQGAVNRKWKISSHCEMRLRERRPLTRPPIPSRRRRRALFCEPFVMLLLLLHGGSAATVLLASSRALR